MTNTAGLYRAAEIARVRGQRLRLEKELRRARECEDLAAEILREAQAADTSNVRIVPCPHCGKGVPTVR